MQNDVNVRHGTRVVIEDLPPELIRLVKVKAAQEGIPMKRLVQRALEREVGNGAVSSQAPRDKTPTGAWITDGSLSHVSFTDDGGQNDEFDLGIGVDDADEAKEAKFEHIADVPDHATGVRLPVGTPTRHGPVLPPGVVRGVEFKPAPKPSSRKRGR